MGPIKPFIGGRRPIRCLLFDLGETLWTHKDSVTEASVICARNRAAAQLLQSFFSFLNRSEDDSLFLSEQFRAAMMQRYLYWRRQVYNHEPDPLLIMNEACQILQLPPLDRVQALKLFEAFRSPLRETRQLFGDVRKTLDALQSKGILLGCVTDRQYGGKPFLEDLQALGLRDYFASHAIVVSADCGRRKPHPAPFLQAISALNIVPEETAMVGDFLSRDVAGAKKLNMIAIWKPKSQLINEIELSPKHPINNREREQKLLTSARKQEREDYPEMPFAELQPFMYPDAIIEHASDLLPILSV